MTCPLDTEAEQLVHMHTILLPCHMIYTVDERRHTARKSSIIFIGGSIAVYKRHTRCFRRLHLLQASDTRLFEGAVEDAPEMSAVAMLF